MREEHTTPVRIIIEQLELIAMHLTGQTYRREHTMKTIEQTQQLTLSAEDARLLFPAIEQAAYLEKGRGNEKAANRLWALFKSIEKMQFYQVLDSSEMRQLAELSENEPIVAQLQQRSGFDRPDYSDPTRGFKGPKERRVEHPKLFALTPEEIKAVRQGFGVED